MCGVNFSMVSVWPYEDQCIVGVQWGWEWKRRGALKIGRDGIKMHIPGMV